MNQGTQYEYEQDAFEKPEGAQKQRRRKRTTLGLASPDHPMFQGPIVIHTQLVSRSDSPGDKQEIDGADLDRQV